VLTDNFAVFSLDSSHDGLLLSDGFIVVFGRLFRPSVRLFLNENWLLMDALRMDSNIEEEKKVEFKGRND
jgi:hypothetical protein